MKNIIKRNKINTLSADALRLFCFSSFSLCVCVSSDHIGKTNDNLTFNLNHKIRFRQDFLEIIYTKLMLAELM